MEEQMTEDQFFAEFAKSVKLRIESEKKLKLDFKKQLKGLINTAGLFRWLDEHDGWNPEGIVDVKLTDERISSYPHCQCARIVGTDDHRLYQKEMMDEACIRGVKHYFVWQTTGYLEDDYSGFILFELKNGKFFKVSYHC